jgi:hypothetical protein
MCLIIKILSRGLRLPRMPYVKRRQFVRRQSFAGAAFDPSSQALNFTSGRSELAEEHTASRATGQFPPALPAEQPRIWFR